jgi:hypothetical protein
MHGASISSPPASSEVITPKLVGARATASPFETFKKYLVRYNTLQTLVWYIFSAWWFSEVYIWSASYDSNLDWVVKAKYVLAAFFD